MERAHQHDVDDGLPSIGREVFGARDEVSSGVVDEDVERSFFPDGFEHPVDCFKAADVAGYGMNRTFGAQLVGGGFQYFLATSADVNRGAEFKEAGCHPFAESGPAAGDEDPLVLQEVFVEHSLHLLR